MKIFLSFLIIISFYSCNKVKISETKTEINAVQEVLNFYNGECLKSKEVEYKNGTEKHIYKLDISKSQLLEQDKKHLKSHSGNIAYLFYSNLKDEKPNYNEIKVKINFENGENKEIIYSDNEIKEIEKIMPNIKEISNQIIENDYVNLMNDFDTSIKIEKNSVENLFNTLTTNYGKISKTQFQGFEFAEINNYGKVIIVNEAVIFDKVNANMILIINRENQKLLSINFP